jgi:hypothetical protein
MITCCLNCLGEPINQYPSYQIFVGTCVYCDEHKYNCVNFEQIIEVIQKISVDEWFQFHNTIQYNQRFIFNHKFDDMISLVRDYYTRELLPRTTLYRARIGGIKHNTFINSVDEPYSVMDMLTPPPNITPGGRANPVGIPYLYTAFDTETTIAELRPWKNADVSLLTILTKKPLIVVDFSQISGLPREFIHPKYLFAINLFVKLKLFGNKISEPVDPNNSQFDYVVTQYFSELMKASGYDGMIYKSTLGPGNNLVIFKSTYNDKDFFEYFDIVNNEVFKVQAMRYFFEKKFSQNNQHT